MNMPTPINMLTPIKKTVNLTFTLVLGAFVTLGLSACAEGQTGDGADTAATNQDTAMADTAMAGGQQGMGQQQGGMMEDSVSLQNTNRMLQQGVTTMSTQAAIENIEGWEQKLENLDASGQVQQVASDMVNTLGDLRSALEGGGQPDAQQVGQAFQQLNSQMQKLMQNASSLNLQDQQQQRLQQLQKSIQQASQELGGGGGGGM
ncbi:MAG: hypothetical protein BRD47_00185 [Bacteroidetes bacterium QS_8_68_28]|nr:MAG: hypothetical protein BRD47_00185 [Bacteroidetes bacterium QS_8_68_28]